MKIAKQMVCKRYVRPLCVKDFFFIFFKSQNHDKEKHFKTFEYATSVRFIKFAKLVLFLGFTLSSLNIHSNRYFSNPFRVYGCLECSYNREFNYLRMNDSFETNKLFHCMNSR